MMSLYLQGAKRRGRSLCDMRAATVARRFVSALSISSTSAPRRREYSGRFVVSVIHARGACTAEISICNSISDFQLLAVQEISLANHFLQREVALPDFTSNDVAIAPMAMDVSGESLETAFPASVNDERAIVLYKPVTPPLFPGGPSVGSQVLLNASILPSGALHPANVLRKDNEVPWLSMPRSAVSGVELSEGEDDHLDRSHHNHLALIPWDPNSPLNLITSEKVGRLADANSGQMPGDDQTSGVDAMDEDNESNMNIVNSQPNNATPSFFSEPWQQYGAPHSQFGSLMRSH